MLIPPWVISVYESVIRCRYHLKGGQKETTG